MELPLRTIEAYSVHPLPSVQADADKMGLVAVINALVPIEPRRLMTRHTLVGYRARPELAQVFELERSMIIPNTGEVRSETV